MGLVLATGCGDATGLTVEDLVGTWQAQSYTFVDDATGQLSEDLVALQGAAFTLVVTADGQATTVFNDGVGGTSSDSGQLSSDGSTLTLGGDTFSASRSGNTLTLVDTNAEYDFDGDGSDEPADLTIQLQR